MVNANSITLLVLPPQKIVEGSHGQGGVGLLIQKNLDRAVNVFRLCERRRALEEDDQIRFVFLSSLEMIDMMLIMVKMQPDQAAAELSEGLQVPVTGEELVNWTATDLIDAFINSPGIRDGLPPREDITVSGSDVNGDTGVVYLAVMDYPEAIPIAMVLECDGWKLSDEVVGSEL